MSDNTQIAKHKKQESPIKYFAPTSMKEAIELSNILSKSSIIPRNYQNKPADCLVAILKGLEIGLKPTQALDSIMVINSKATMYGDGLLALVQSSNVYEYHHESCDGETATCTVKRKGSPEYTVTFTFEDAKNAGLLIKDIWKKYKKRMLQMRARAFALRDQFADVLNGMQMYEEVIDYDDNSGRTINVIDDPIMMLTEDQRNEFCTDEEYEELVSFYNEDVIDHKHIKKVLKRIGISSSDSVENDLELTREMPRTLFMKWIESLREKQEKEKIAKEKSDEFFDEKSTFKNIDKDELRKDALEEGDCKEWNVEGVNYNAYTQGT